jgi:signal peptidase I
MVRELVETVVLSLIIFLLIRQVVQNYRIENHSMEPNFYEGQFVLVNKLAYCLGQPIAGMWSSFTTQATPTKTTSSASSAARRHGRGARPDGLCQRPAAAEDFPHNPIQPGDYMPPDCRGRQSAFRDGRQPAQLQRQPRLWANQPGFGSRAGVAAYLAAD